jgi:hypothetical protein
LFIFITAPFLPAPHLITPSAIDKACTALLIRISNIRIDSVYPAGFQATYAQAYPHPVSAFRTPTALLSGMTMPVWRREMTKAQ